MDEQQNRASGQACPLTLRDLIALADAGAIPQHIADRIERGDIFAVGLCWCGRARDEHPSLVLPGEPGPDHVEEPSATRSLHRMLGLGQEPLPHTTEMHSEALREHCVRCRIDQWRAEKATAAGGHRDLRVSDFGWWHCRACDRRGDDWDNPADYPCEPEDGPR